MGVNLTGSGRKQIRMQLMEMRGDSNHENLFACFFSGGVDYSANLYIFQFHAPSPPAHSQTLDMQ